MTGKEYFENIKKTIDKRRSLNRHLSDLRANLTAVGGFDYSKDRVQSSPKNTQEEKIIKLLDAQAQYYEMIADCSQMIMEAEERLSELSAPEYAEVIRMYYLENKHYTYEIIGEKMRYSTSWVKQLMSKGLEEFEIKWLS